MTRRRPAWNLIDPLGLVTLVREADVTKEEFLCALPPELSARRLDGWRRDPGARSTLAEIYEENTFCSTSTPAHEAGRDAAERWLRGALLAGWIVALEASAARVAPTPPPPPPPPPLPPIDPVVEYAVRLVDETAEPLPGIVVTLEIDGAPTAHTTDDEGFASGRGRAATATARIIDRELLRATLAARWATPRPRSVVTGTDVRVLHVEDSAELVVLRADVPVTLVFEPRGVRRVRLVGMFFDINLCFLLPDAIPGIRRICEEQASDENDELLVVGHTDTDGDASFNDALSLERAEAVAAYLRNDVDAWLPYFEMPDARRWAYREVQHMLSRVSAEGAPYYAGRAHGQLDPATVAAIRRFQRDRGLPETGTGNRPTHRALISAYMAIEGTTLPPSVALVTHGCGEHFPARDSGPGVSDAENRRVEVFFFDGPIDPRPASKISRAGSSDYPRWTSRVVETIDARIGDTATL